MWNPFKKPKSEETKFEYRVIDWTKVTTVEDVVNILSNIGLTRRVKVGKVEWEDPKWARLLGDKVYTETWPGRAGNGCRTRIS